ncbi:hypothetical protein VP01_3141g1 [Puccinia sorghi]|uniref:Uncharacterized protein n=1 Tax=Puccinia sorghi TaxID=27349 RepID=A0A0L6UZS8_9BASI|nr:hypothetical protein VP01_3141g1 [Puccinia sorghi]
MPSATLSTIWKYHGSRSNIPVLWNKPKPLEQQANIVYWHGMDLGQKVFSVDESGFELHSGQSSGYAPTRGPFVALAWQVPLQRCYHRFGS